MGADGCRLIRMGENGCMVKGESKNKGKRSSNARAGDVFRRMQTVTKNRMCAGMVMVVREDD